MALEGAVVYMLDGLGFRPLCAKNVPWVLVSRVSILPTNVGLGLGRMRSEAEIDFNKCIYAHQFATLHTERNSLIKGFSEHSL